VPLSVWSLWCHSATWSYDHHCCMVHPDFCDVILISIFLIFCLIFPLFSCLLFCIYIFLFLWSTQEVVPFSLCLYANYLQYVCFSWYCKCKHAFSSNLFTSAMWLFFSSSSFYFWGLQRIKLHDLKKKNIIFLILYVAAFHNSFPCL